MDKKHYDNLTIDEVIEALLQAGDSKISPENISPRAIQLICEEFKEVILKDPMLLRITVDGLNLNIFGDIHGQHKDLIRLFNSAGRPPGTRHLFLGDFVDRGDQSIEVILLLVAYKVKFPEHIYIIRGNHEDSDICKDFKGECKKRYSLDVFWYVVHNVFDNLPVAALINDSVLCMHGGLSPDFRSYLDIESMKRPIKVPNKGLLCDLLWSDPCDIKGWAENEGRGLGKLFGADVVQQTVKKFKLSLVLRAHEFCCFGTQSFALGKLLTVFSAPGYCGEENYGAYIRYREDETFSIEILKPLKRKSDKSNVKGSTPRKK